MLASGRSTLNARVRDSSRRRRQAEQLATREAILAAAGEILLEPGYEAFSLRQVAERVGFTPTTIYRHFEDKDDLVFAVTDEGFRIFGARLREAAAEQTDPFATIVALGHAYVGFGLEYPIYYRLMFMQRPDYLVSVPAGRKETRIASFNVLRSTVESAVATGQTRHTDAESISHALWALVHGIVALAISMPFLHPTGVRAMTNTALDMAVVGLRHP